MNRKQFEDLLDRFTPELRKAFLQGVDDIKDKAQIKAIADALKAGDVDAALRALNLDAAAFAALDYAIQAAFVASGAAQIDGMKLPRGVVFRFDARNTLAEQIIRQHSAALVTAITEDQRAGLRAILLQGMEDGRNPRSVALDIVGRIAKPSNRRKGGIVGLTAKQMQYVQNMRRELLSGDIDQMANYFTRARRDARFDTTVRKYVRQEKALPADLVDRIAGRYSDRLLLLRGETIARTEALGTLNRGRVEAIQQMISQGLIDREDVRQVWVATTDKRTRDTHREMNRQETGYNGTFTSPSGATLRYPGDPSAPASEIINCRCTIEYKVDFLAGIGRE